MQGNPPKRSPFEVHAYDDFQNLEVNIAGDPLKLLVLLRVKVAAHHVPVKNVHLVIQPLAQLFNLFW